MAEALLERIENPDGAVPKKEMVSGRLIHGGTVTKL
jgi:LacI family transcriptional regulator